MSRSASIIENNPNTRLVIISACSGVTNLLVELASGIDTVEKRTDIISKITAIHDSVLSNLNQGSELKPTIDLLLADIAQFSEQAANKTSAEITDQLVSCGELLSTLLFAQLLRERGNNAVRFDIRQVLKTDSQFGRALPDIEQIKNHCLADLRPACENAIVVSQGFIGSDQEGKTTTLGRGGSDYSAALLAEGINAACLEIWTDVPGIYTTDPRIAPAARPIPEISFSEASEMANFGAKILHPSTLIPAVRHQIPVFVGSSKDPEAGGTWVKEKSETLPLFRALALRGNQTMITLHSLNMFHSYGFLAEVFTILAQHKISVDLITTSEVSVSLTLDQPDTCGGSPQLPQEAFDELSKLCRVEVESDLSLVALIGNSMSSTKGAGKQVFGTLEDYNLRMICYGASPHNLCFLVNETDAKNVVKELHQALFE
ncbi:lysine-sensitive aspartokinase 3 [Vibrio sp. SS-MA-C1-2]|nr:lysine-sensitive aspartokinase 3 [Vibrio sp. SS-MA-C1-2]